MSIAPPIFREGLYRHVFPFLDGIDAVSGMLNNEEVDMLYVP